MDKKQLQKIQDKLTQEKTDVEADLTRFGGKNIEYPEYGNEEGENANEITDFNDNVAIKANLEKVLLDINNALSRIKKGTYGKCKYCEKEISIKRLLVRPSSSACVRCKEKLTGTM